MEVGTVERGAGLALLGLDPLADIRLLGDVRRKQRAHATDPDPGDASSAAAGTRMVGKHQQDFRAELAQSADQPLRRYAEAAADVGRKLPAEHEDAHRTRP